jgi:uncharacterized protein YjiS (DUF1127 family)
MESPVGMCRPDTPRAQNAGRAAGWRISLTRLLVPWPTWIAAWRKGRSDGELLARLDDRSLRDIGIDRAKVEDESSVSFWRLR